MSIVNKLVLPNVGLIDGIARVFLGTFLVCGAFIGQLEWGWVGLYPLLTGASGISPLYAVLKINTHRKAVA